MQGVLVKAYDGLAFYLKEPPYSFYHPDMGDFAGTYLPFTVNGGYIA
jgi:hypothetical protein